jgi:hypothetical protein
MICVHQKTLSFDLAFQTKFEKVQSNILPSYSEAINNNHQNYLLFPNSPPSYYYEVIFKHSNQMLTSDVVHQKTQSFDLALQTLFVKVLMKNKNGENIIQCKCCGTTSGTLIKELYHNWNCKYNKYSHN